MSCPIEESATVGPAPWRRHRVQPLLESEVQSDCRAVAHAVRTHLALSSLENAVAEGHWQHFVNHQASYAALEMRAKMIEANLTERDRVFGELVGVWREDTFAKGFSTPGKIFFHKQARAQHFALLKVDMSYLIYEEQRLGLEDHLKDLCGHMAWYKKAYP